MKTCRAYAVPLVVLALVAGACGDDDEGETAEPPTTTEAGGDVPVHTIGVSEEGDRYTFEVPQGIRAGAATFELDNTGEKVHNFQLARLDGQHSDDELIQLVSREDAPFPEWIHAEGGVGSTGPGSRTPSTVRLEEGEYVYFCTQSDEDEENEEEGSPTTAVGEATATATTLPGPEPAKAHIAKGMLGRFSVSGDSGAALPKADATISASEYTFSTPASLDSGESTVEFTNTGEQPHHAVLFPIADGKTIRDVAQAFASQDEPTGPPPVDFEKGVELAAIDPGRTEVTDVVLEAGKYAMICFLPDRGTAGPPHVAKGMLVELTVS